MKESTRTLVPLPGFKKKANNSAAPSKAALSQEFVESDDSSHENAPQPKRAGEPKTTIGIHKPNGVAKPRLKSSAKEPATPKNTTKPSALLQKPGPIQMVTQKLASTLSTVKQAEESDVLARLTQGKVPGNEEETSLSESHSDSRSDSSSDESSAAAMSQHRERPVKIHSGPSKSHPLSLPHVVEFNPTQPYVPPRNFNPVPINARTTSKAGGLFDSLKGKQIWHMTAPNGVSLKDLKELTMDKALNGAVVLSHKGADYRFSQADKSEDGTREVLAPQADGYKIVSARISQTLHLRAIAHLPSLDSKQADQRRSLAAAASITRSTIRAPRPQVKGLKMRFIPTGFGGDATSTLGDSDSEVDARRGTPGFGVPNDSVSASRKEKRKHAVANGEEAADLPLKKSKKKRSLEELTRKEERRVKKHKKRAQVAALSTS
ncbi:DNA-directed RNA polymerase I subunit RPA34.5-domain-containing protein [Pyrenochaeta sp. MPI-SDFR-AT-0127]|nr:DNA-directed RNA polymerase I subunit RPA34.5-domain-containing protein [Pyrenochaeta sp. MPI-SDFR-AT-0127]